VIAGPDPANQRATALEHRITAGAKKPVAIMTGAAGTDGALLALGRIREDDGAACCGSTPS
jgi:hypothetical protein